MDSIQGYDNIIYHIVGEVGCEFGTSVGHNKPSIRNFNS